MNKDIKNLALFIVGCAAGLICVECYNQGKNNQYKKDAKILNLINDMWEKNTSRMNDMLEKEIEIIDIIKSNNEESE